MIFIYLWFTENNLADFEKASNSLVEIPPEVNKEKAIFNSSLSTTNNCSDSGTTTKYNLFKKIKCKFGGLMSNVYYFV